MLSCMPADTLNILVLGQDDTATYKTIDGSLESLQREVDGLIEAIPLRPSLRERGMIGLCNEEGRLREDLHPNPFSFTLLRRSIGTQLLMGNVFIVRTDGAEFASLREGDVRMLNHLLQEAGVQPETADV